MSNPHDAMERELAVDGTAYNKNAIALSTTKADTQLTRAGWYDISCDQDEWFWTGPATTAVSATVNSRHQWGKDTVRVKVGASQYISMILSTGTGSGFINLVQDQ